MVADISGVTWESRVKPKDILPLLIDKGYKLRVEDTERGKQLLVYYSLWKDKEFKVGPVHSHEFTDTEVLLNGVHRILDMAGLKVALTLEHK